MDRRERAPNAEETIRAAFDSMKAGLWAGMPGIIQSYDPAAMTVVVQPAIQGRIRDIKGNFSFVNMPLLLDVPVVFSAGGGLVMTMPIAEGDECFVAFADRCIDAWWQQGGVQPPMELRMHDLSDGFAFVGVFSQPNVIPNVSTTTAQLRNAAGDTYVEVDPAGKVRITAADIEVHATNSYAQDVYGYGQKITYLSGKNYQIDTYDSDAVITTIDHPVNQPDAT